MGFGLEGPMAQHLGSRRGSGLEPRSAMYWGLDLARCLAIERDWRSEREMGPTMGTQKAQSSAASTVWSWEHRYEADLRVHRSDLPMVAAMVARRDPNWASGSLSAEALAGSLSAETLSPVLAETSALASSAEKLAPALYNRSSLPMPD